MYHIKKVYRALELFTIPLDKNFTLDQHIIFSVGFFSTVSKTLIKGRKKDYLE